jgi:hypothetical protein
VTFIVKNLPKKIHFQQSLSSSALNGAGFSLSTRNSKNSVMLVSGSVYYSLNLVEKNDCL